jgi:hypothetical protein
MIKITRKDGMNPKILEVTQGAFENIYRKQGYVPFVPETADSRPQTAEEPPPKSDDELFMDAVKMKPISQWTKEEMIQYAKLAGIDPNQKTADLRNSIQKTIENGQP